MRIGKVIGTVTATTKDEALVGSSMLVVDVVDLGGKVIEPSLVAVDACGAGVGQNVLVTTGSAARLPSGKAGIPTDATVVAILDEN